MSDIHWKIMVVDDDVNIRAVLRYRFEKEGYHVFLANDGFDALETLEKLRDRKPDLIILDLAMPRVDGWEMLRRLKDNPEMQHIPVIVLTAFNSVSSEKKSLELGVARFVPKPFSPRELVADVRAVLGMAA